MLSAGLNASVAGALCGYLSPDLLDGVTEHVLAQLTQRKVKPDVARTYVQTVGQIR